MGPLCIMSIIIMRILLLLFMYFCLSKIFNSGLTSNRVSYTGVFLVLLWSQYFLVHWVKDLNQSSTSQKSKKLSLQFLPVPFALQLQYLTGMTDPLSLLWYNEIPTIWANLYVVHQVHWFTRCIWARRTSCCAQHNEEEPMQDAVPWKD